MSRSCEYYVDPGGTAHAKVFIERLDHDNKVEFVHRLRKIRTASSKSLKEHYVSLQSVNAITWNHIYVFFVFDQQTVVLLDGTHLNKDSISLSTAIKNAEHLLRQMEKNYVTS